MSDGYLQVILNVKKEYVQSKPFVKPDLVKRIFVCSQCESECVLQMNIERKSNCYIPRFICVRLENSEANWKEKEGE